jgi:uncharacterized membrane protein YjfL (UPF0719 family)
LTTIDWTELTTHLYSGGALMMLFVVIFIFSKFINDLLTPYDIDNELTEKDNVALAVSLCGYFAAVIIIFISALIGPSKGLLQDVINTGGYSLLGILLLNLSRIINDKLILRKFSNQKEIIQDRNVGTGAVQFGSYVASGLIVGGAIHGEGGGVLTAIVFFALGQVALILFTGIYNRITPFDIHDEIEKDNVAAGVSFGGTLVALGIILMKGNSGTFISWSENLGYFATDTIIAFIALPLIRIFFDKILIHNADLNTEIKTDKNLGAGLLEMTVAVGFAAILYFLL